MVSLFLALASLAWVENWINILDTSVEFKRSERRHCIVQLLTTIATTYECDHNKLSKSLVVV